MKGLRPDDRLARLPQGIRVVEVSRQAVPGLGATCIIKSLRDQDHMIANQRVTSKDDDQSIWRPVLWQ
jgi:hypothetical protein